MYKQEAVEREQRPKALLNALNQKAQPNKELVEASKLKAQELGVIKTSNANAKTLTQLLLNIQTNNQTSQIAKNIAARKLLYPKMAKETTN